MAIASLLSALSRYGTILTMVDGQVRLTGGTTVNQGLVEVYCNGQWGTVCHDGFHQSAVNTVCKQLWHVDARSPLNVSIITLHAT